MMNKKASVTSIYNNLLCIFVFTQVFAITVFNTIVTIFQFIILGFLFIFSLFFGLKIRKEDFLIYLLFYSLGLLSITVWPFLIFLEGQTFLEFIPSSYGRVFNIFCFSFFYFCFVNQNVKIQYKMLIRAYLFACSVLVFFGIWQLLHNFFNIYYPPFITSTFIHSIENVESLTVSSRITSLAREPSYLITYLMEPLVFYVFDGQYKYRKTKILLILIVLFFTLSLSGFCNFALLVLYYLLISKGSKKYRLICLLVFVICLIMMFGQNIVLSVFSRLDYPVLQKSARFQEMIFPTEFLINKGYYFGFGPKGYLFAADNSFYHYGWLKGRKITSYAGMTSHVIFIDFFTDYGILGFLFIITFFIYLWKKTYNLYKKNNNPIPNLLLVNYLISNLYVVDYTSPHSVIIISFILFYLRGKTEYSQNYKEGKLLESTTKS